MLTPTEKIGINSRESLGDVLRAWRSPAIEIGDFLDVEHLQIAAILIELESLNSLMDLAISGGEENVPAVVRSLTALTAYCQWHDLEMSEMAIQPLLDVLRSPSPSPLQTFKNQVDLIRGRIHDELRIPRFFFIPREKARFFEKRDKANNLIPPFGPEVQDLFGELAGRDIDEAGKSYAAGRNTACVFHLMRVIEVGLEHIKKTLDVTTSSPNWENIIKELQKEADVRVGKNPNWRGPHRFYSDCLAQLRNIKDAWRNPVMHVVEWHDEGSAFSIYEHTKAFMQRLAKGP